MNPNTHTHSYTHTHPYKNANDYFMDAENVHLEASRTLRNLSVAFFMAKVDGGNKKQKKKKLKVATLRSLSIMNAYDFNIPFKKDAVSNGTCLIRMNNICIDSLKLLVAIFFFFLLPLSLFLSLVSLSLFRSLWKYVLDEHILLLLCFICYSVLPFDWVLLVKSLYECH